MNKDIDFRFVPDRDGRIMLDVDVRRRLTDETSVEFRAPNHNKNTQPDYVKELFKYITGIERIIVLPFVIRIILGRLLRWEDRIGKIQFILRMHFSPDSLTSTIEVDGLTSVEPAETEVKNHK